MQAEGEGFFFDDDIEPAPQPATAPTAQPAATAPTAQPAARRQPARQTWSVDPEGEAALDEALAEMESRGAPPLGDSAPRPPPQPTGSCIECRKADGQQKFRDAFGLEVCYECQRANRVTSRSTALPGRTHETVRLCAGRGRQVPDHQQVEGQDRIPRHRHAGAIPLR